MKTIGIDLAGKEKNPTGIGVLKNRRIKTGLFHSDEEIIERCESENPSTISIDAPLSFPDVGSFRKCDNELIKRGYRVFPPGFGGMKVLTERGIHLSKELRGNGFEVIEIHPLTSGMILFETKNRENWLSSLSKQGWELECGVSEHEVDSMIAAFVAFLHMRGETERIGEEGKEIVIP